MTSAESARNPSGQTLEERAQSVYAQLESGLAEHIFGEKEAHACRLFNAIGKCLDRGEFADGIEEALRHESDKLLIRAEILAAWAWERADDTGNEDGYWVSRLRAALDGMVRQYQAGDKMALFEAVENASVVGQPIPEWAHRALREAISSYAHHEVASLGEAFGLPDLKDPRRKAKLGRGRRGLSHIVEVYLDVEDARRRGQSVGPALFEDVSKQHPGLSPKRVEQWYYEFRPEGLITRPRKKDGVS